MPTDATRGSSRPVRPGFALPGFTLVELLVVIGIIVLLVGILLPMATRVRTAAQAAATAAEINNLEGVINQYYQTVGSYPGILTQEQTNNVVYTPLSSPANVTQPGLLYNGGASYSALLLNGTVAAGTGVDGAQITGSESLVLSLLGGLTITTTTGSTATSQFVYDPNEVGLGPKCLAVQPNAATLTPLAPKRYAVMADKKYLSDGLFKIDGGEGAHDTVIPEFVDTFSRPLPILYLRASRGNNGNVTYSALGVCGHNGATANAYVNAQYQIEHVLGYTAPVGDHGLGLPFGKFHGLRYCDKSDTTAAGAAGLGDNVNVFDGLNYLTNPQAGSTTIPVARAKDAFILISAGRDRIYGTADDITTFGSVR